MFWRPLLKIQSYRSKASPGNVLYGTCTDERFVLNERIRQELMSSLEADPIEQDANSLTFDDTFQNCRP